VLYCRGWQRVVERDSAQSVFNKLTAMPTHGDGFSVPVATLVGEWDEVATVCAAGFHDLLIEKSIRELDEITQRRKTGTLASRRGPFRFRAAEQKAHHDSLEQAFHYGKGRLNLLLPTKIGARAVQQSSPLRPLRYFLPRSGAQSVFV
jgi:hypothetical protein